MHNDPWHNRSEEDRYYIYNMLDCVNTFECWEAIEKATKARGLEEQQAFQQEMFFPILTTMIRGVCVNQEEQKRMRKEANQARIKVLRDIQYVVGYEINPSSPKQLGNFFYDEMGVQKVFKRGRQGASTDKEALAKIAEREPMLRSFIEMLEMYRSLQVFESTFLKDATDPDGRMRCGYNIAGTSTFRLSSRANAFGRGINLQNIPSGDE